MQRKATIQPPKKRKSGKGAPPSEDQPSSNLGISVSSGRVAFNMDVPAGAKTSFKIHATVKGYKNMGDLFEEVWNYYQENHKDT